MWTRIVAFLQGLVRDRSGWVLVAFGLAALVAVVPASRVAVDTSLENFLVQDDPEHDRNLEIKHEFSNDEILVVALDVGRPFEAADLRELYRLAEGIRSIDGVDEVLELSTIEDVRSDGDFLDASPLVDLERAETDLAEIRARVEDHRVYRRNLVSPEGDVFGLIVIPELRDRSHHVNFRVTGAVMAWLAAESTWPYYVSGYPAAEYEGNRLLMRDVAVLVSVALLVVGGLVWLAARRFFPVCFVLGLIAWCELMTLAWMGGTGTALSTVTVAVPAVLLATSATYAIYLIGLLREVADEPEPGVAVIAHVVRPALLSAISTGIGFLSLRLMPVTVLGQLGTALTAGIVAAVLAAILLLPAVVQRYSLRLEILPPENVDRWITTGVRWGARPWLTLAVSAVLAAVAAVGATRLTVDSDPIHFWQPDSYHRVSDRFINDRLAGTLPINVIVHGDGPDGALDPEVLAFTDALVREVATWPTVDLTVSFLDYLWLMDAALRPGETPRTVLPSRDLAAQYMLLYEAGGDPADYRHYINHDRSALNVFVRIHSRSSQDVLALRERIHAFAHDYPGAPRIEVLGTWFLFPKAMDGITRGMVRGLILAMALITLVMIAALRSLRLGAVAIIPNVFPILVCTGTLGWLGIPLSMGTAIVGCVALGLAVDDTAHVIGHLGRGRSVESVYRAVGRPLILTTLILGAGFGALATSDFQPLVHLGFATMLTLVAALLCDLLLLPSLLALVGYPLRDRA